MKRILSLMGIVCGCVFLSGCGGSEYEGPKRYPISGKVTFNGEVVDVGTIAFLPLSEDEGRVSGGPITDGTYTVPEAKGATAGEYRVEIRWAKATGKILKTVVGDEPERKEAIPAEFNTNSELTVEVGEDQTTFDFDLKSEAKPAAEYRDPYEPS